MLFGHISGYSMAPTLKNGQTVQYDCSRKRKKNIRRNDIVAIKNKHVSTGTMIKRVVAIEGDSVFAYDGILYINGQAEKFKPFGKTENVKQLVVPKGCIYVLGDNRQNSTDSRTYGPMKKSKVVGVFEKIIPVKMKQRTKRHSSPTSFKETYNYFKKEIYKRWNLEE